MSSGYFYITFDVIAAGSIKQTDRQDPIVKPLNILQVTDPKCLKIMSQSCYNKTHGYLLTDYLWKHKNQTNYLIKDYLLRRGNKYFCVKI